MQAAPLFDDIARAPAGGEAWWIDASDGARIRVAVWPAAPEKPARGAVLLFPGRTEYIEKYGPAATHYTKQGFAVLVIDWRGQGLTARAMADPRLGHVVDFDEYQRDLAAAMNLAQWLELPEPFFLVAHSMGGCIGLRALHEGLPVKAAAFSSPMWGIQLEAWERPLAWLSGLVGPKIGLGGRLAPRTDLDHALFAQPFEDNELTTDRDMWDFMRDQLVAYPALTLGGPTLAWVGAALLETVRLMRMAPPDLPALTFLATNERIVEPRPIRRQMARWPGGRLEIADRAEHEIMMERPEIRDRFFDASTALFLEQA